MCLNIEKNRKSKKYTTNELLKRVIWRAISPLFFLSPRLFYRWRVFLLKSFGAEIGKSVHIYPSAVIKMPWNLKIGDYSAIGEDVLIYNLGETSLGKNVTVSHKAHICAGTHDFTDPSLPLLKPPIVIEDNAWICTEAFIAPDVTIGEGAVVGAAAKVFKDVEEWTVVGGNPAKFIKKRTMNLGD